MKQDYADHDLHALDFWYRRLCAVGPVAPDDRDLEIATVCDGDTQTTYSVTYAHGQPKDKWHPEKVDVSMGKVKIPRK